MKKIINSNNAPSAIGPYSQAILVDNIVYISGQLGIVPSSGQFAGDSVLEQTIQAFKNIEAILIEAGSSLGQVVKTTCFIKDMNDFAIVNEIYKDFFQEESYPARSVIEVSRLPKDGLVEIETIATIS